MAHTKMMVELGAASSNASVFNPDIYFNWAVSRGYFPTAADDIRELTDPGVAAVTYAREQGYPLTKSYVRLSGGNTASDVQTVMDYINAGYYVILHAGS